MNKISEIKKLNKQIRGIQDKICSIEDKEIEEVQVPKIKKMVGWCMKSIYNDFSFGKIEEIVKSKDEFWYFIFEEVGIDTSGCPFIRISSDHPYTNKEWWNSELPLSGWIKISEEEYQKQRLKVLKEMNSRNKVRKLITGKKI